MRKAGGAALLILACLGAHDGALGEVRSVELRTPRAFGYFAGDSVRLEAVVVTNGDTRLNLASLPHPRVLRPWLDLRAVAFDEEKAASGEKRYRLRFDYQLLDAPLEAAERTIPPVTVKFETAGSLADAVVPEWRVLISPLRGALPGAVPELMSDIAARPASLGWHIQAMGAAAFGALLALGLLAHHHAWWPFRRRKARPFTAAARAIRHLTNGAQGEGVYRDSLLALHRAFDDAAGKRVFAADIDGFLDGHPEYRSARHEIGQFFAASRRAFYGSDLAGASETHPIEAVSALSQRMSRLERQAA
jgi:mxaA protein